MLNNCSDIYNELVFDDRTMREKLPKNIYDSLKKTIKEGMTLDSSIAEVTACAMKDWAISKGATHYCHWFIPMTGSPAEKHNAFLSKVDDGQIIMEFSGNNLIIGESDASSFPSGGLRATFEARGYTAWDCTSPAFIKDSTLCIPTVFCSYTGEALDKKTPLLRSMDAVNKSSLRLLKILGDTTTKMVYPSIGAEQEYFLVDKEIHSKRLDLKLTGKTLFGNIPPKGQELDDHYYGNIKQRVSEYMCDLDKELWRLGIASKTKHNEAAPSQHELAPIHEIASVACDRNHLTMEVMKKVARKHNLACLLSEKPFTNVNGSGKHVNYSLITDTNINLFKPSKNAESNKRFLLFIAAVITSIDKYADLLRFSASSVNNDLRLGSHEAPPSIISLFLGEDLTEIFKKLLDGKDTAKSKKSILDMGIASVPPFFLDSTDRNRTSPIAFTGDKFEFRMTGSSMSISEPTVMLNTSIAESLDMICETLENSTDLNKGIVEVVNKIMSEHSRIIFNGDGYSKEWYAEAEKRGLPMFKDSVAVAPILLLEKNKQLFTKYKIFTESEINSRYEMFLRSYSKTVNIDAKTMLEMAVKYFEVAGLKHMNELIQMFSNAKTAGLDEYLEYKKPDFKNLALINKNINEAISSLKEKIQKANTVFDKTIKRSSYFRDEVLLSMRQLRNAVDALEIVLPAELYPMPNYTQLMFWD